MSEPIALRTPVCIDPHKLQFDNENPRFLPGDLEDLSSDLSDFNIIKILANKADLSELIQSILANSYIKIEPMVVLKSEDDEKYIVLEGNRRLAAVKVLMDDNVAMHLGMDTQGITDKVKDSLKGILVYRVETREEADDFIGFKHVNGPQKWDPLAKARFAMRLYDSQGEKKNIREISNKLGDSHDTVKRMIQGLYVLNQAENNNLFMISDCYTKNFSFSHLYTAITKSGYRDYLGLAQDCADNEPMANPVPIDKLDSLKNVLMWIYGSKEESLNPLIKSQNPDLKKLGEILENSDAVKNLQANYNLDDAYTVVRPLSDQFSERLHKARNTIKNALTIATSYNHDDIELLTTAETIKNDARAIHGIMTQPTNEE